MNLKPFLSWCTTQGIVSPLAVRERADGFRYTVLQVRDHDMDTTTTELVRAPLQACLTAPSHAELAERLLHERSLGDDSHWARPYLTLLPDLACYQHTMPRFWSSERMESVSDGGMLAEEVALDARDRLADFSSSDLDRAWAMACVDSRCNLLPDRSYALTPLMDFMNHDGSVPTTAKVETDSNNNEQQTFVLQVLTASLPQPISAAKDEETAAAAAEKKPSFFGALFQANNNKQASQSPASLNKLQQQQQQQQQPADEVCISYGDLTNLQTLLNYGFVRTDNPCNSETVSVPLLTLPVPIRVEIAANGSIDPVALGALRRAVATADEEAQLAADSPSDGQRTFASMVPFLSVRNELEAHAVLAGYLEESVYDARQGATTASAKDDFLVRDYLLARATTLQAALDRIQTKFPQVFG